MALPGQLTPPERLLLGPGPSNAHPRVLAALSAPVLGHLDPQFLAIMAETQAMLRQIFRTENGLTMPLSATGMAGMEACLANLVEPGDRVLVCRNGFFGGRMVDVAGRCGAEVRVIDRPWGEVFSHDEIAEAVRDFRPKVVGIVHAETSTGAHQPMAGLGDVCHEHDALLLMDAVTSLGCVEVSLDEWGVDAAYSCSQKGLSCPPGLAPVSFSPRAVDAIRGRRSKCQSWYLDLSMLFNYWAGEKRAYHHTAPVSMTYALYEGCRVVLEEGLAARWGRHERNHRALKAGLNALGLEYTAGAGCQLPQLNAVRIPDGIDDAGVRGQLLDEFHIEVGGGLGDFKGGAWRIGLMGQNSTPNAVFQVLAALEHCLRQRGVNAPPGGGVAAAVSALPVAG